MLTLLTGAAAGLFHVLSGPDHLAAVAPIAADEKVKNTRYCRPVMCHQISWSDRGFPQFIAGERDAAHGR